MDYGEIAVALGLFCDTGADCPEGAETMPPLIKAVLAPTRPTTVAVKITQSAGIVPELDLRKESMRVQHFYVPFFTR